LLDDRRTVLHYLGPHHLDAAGLLAALGSTCKIEGLLEPVGCDVHDDSRPSCGDRGAGGCCSSGADSSSRSCSACETKCVLASTRSQRHFA
jgi:hypothetical protein